MEFQNGILYIFISLLTIVVNSTIKSITDYLENRKIVKSGLKKHTFVSLLIVGVYLAFYYFTTKTTRFDLTTEDSIYLLLIYIFSIVYFNLNATISTIVNKILIKKRKRIDYGFV